MGRGLLRAARRDGEGVGAWARRPAYRAGGRVSILSHTRPEWTYAGLRRLPLARLSCRSTRRTRQRSATTCCITPGRERCSSRTPSRWRRSAPSMPCWVADPRRARSCLTPTLDCTSGARSGGETCLCCRHSRVRSASPQHSANRVGRRERLANLCHGCGRDRRQAPRALADDRLKLGDLAGETTAPIRGGESVGRLEDLAPLAACVLGPADRPSGAKRVVASLELNLTI